jgi:hypothetical protein
MPSTKCLTTNVSQLICATFTSKFQHGASSAILRWVNLKLEKVKIKFVARIHFFKIKILEERQKSKKLAPKVTKNATNSKPTGLCRK